jgi:hypothetical protein
MIWAQFAGVTLLNKPCIVTEVIGKALSSGEPVGEWWLTTFDGHYGISVAPKPDWSHSRLP